MTARLACLTLLSLAAACAPAATAATDTAAASAGVDSLNARLADAFRRHDPAAYAATFTDSAAFEWPAFDTVRGRAALEAMARGNWAALADMDLRLTVDRRVVAADRVTEFGAFAQSYADSTGKRSTEYGRYVALLVRRPDGWRMDRWVGFADSTRPAPAP